MHIKFTRHIFDGFHKMKTHPTHPRRKPLIYCYLKYLPTFDIYLYHKHDGDSYDRQQVSNCSPIIVAPGTQSARYVTAKSIKGTPSHINANGASDHSESSVLAFRTSHLPQPCQEVLQGLSKGHAVLQHQHDAPRKAASPSAYRQCRTFWPLVSACRPSARTAVISEYLSNHAGTRFLTMSRLTAKPVCMLRL